MTPRVSFFPAQAFLQGRTVAGELKVEDQGLTFKPQSPEVVPVFLSFTDLQIRLGGHNDEQVFFTHPRDPTISVFTREMGILGHDVFKSNPLWRDSLRRVGQRRKGSRRWAIALAVFLALILGGIFLLVAQKDRIVRWIADQIPRAWEQKMGDQIFSQLQREGKLAREQELNSALKGMTERLVKATGEGWDSFQFHIIEDKTWNAFAVPGGHVFIHTGLLEAAHRPEEVAGVLAHEIAHVTERHNVRQIINSAGLFLVVQAALGDASGLLAVLADSSRFLLGQKFSRDFEREADDRGWEYLVAARIDPEGMITFFERLKKEQERNPLAGPSVSWISTHPPTQERIDRLKRKMRNHPRD